MGALMALADGLRFEEQRAWPAAGDGAGHPPAALFAAGWRQTAVVAAGIEIVGHGPPFPPPPPGAVAGRFAVVVGGLRCPPRRVCGPSPGGRGRLPPSGLVH